LQQWTAIEFTIAVVAGGGVFAPRQTMKTQRGLALPMVVVLSCLCSVLLLAQWRNLAMAQALGQSAGLRWQLKQSALDTLRLAVDDIRLGASDARHQLGNSSDSHAFFPTTMQQWQVLQSRLTPNECQTGICRPLESDNAALTPWLTRLDQAQKAPSPSGQSAKYWVEILPLPTANSGDAVFIYRITALAQNGEGGAQSGWQALWQPNPDAASRPSAALPTVDWVRLLPLSP
jgi:type II secretory pathway component PulJ